jgi:hypothetical protein
VLITAVLAVALGAGIAATVKGDLYTTTDFRCVWGGARAIVTGVDPYDRERWEAIVGRPTVEANGRVVAICPDRYRYPLWTAVLTTPLGLVPLERAAAAWAMLSVAAVLSGIGLVWSLARGRDGFLLYAAIVLSSQPFWLLAVSGQLSGLLFGAIVLELWLAAARRDRGAGALLATLAAKPQLFALYVPLRVGRALMARHWGYVAAAALAGLGLLAVSVWILPSWPAAWLGDIFGDRAGIHHPLATAWDLGGGPVPGALLISGAIVGCAVLVGRRPLSLPESAGLSLALSLFAAPYAWSYDLLGLALPWGLTLANASRTPAGWQLRVGLLVVASLFPWVLYAVAFQRGDERLSALVTLATAWLLAASVRAGGVPGRGGMVAAP